MIRPKRGKGTLIIEAHKKGGSSAGRFCSAPAYFDNRATLSCLVHNSYASSASRHKDRGYTKEAPMAWAFGLAALIYFAIARSAIAAQDAQPGRDTLAQMVAFARLGSVACQRLAPDVEGFHALVLLRLITPPLTEKEIVANEKDVVRLRDRLGLSRWCKLYAGEMEQARI